MTDMRVGLVTIEFLPVWGGVASYYLNLCSALSDKVQLHVFTPFRKVRGATFTLDDLGKKLNDLNVKVYIISSTSNTAFSTLKYQIALAHKLPQLITQYRIDLIHCACPLAEQLARTLGIISSTPYVLSYFSTPFGQRQGTASSRLTFKDIDHTEKVTLLFYPFLKSYEFISLRKTKNVLVSSKSVRDELLTHYGYKGKITIAHHGVDTSLFQPNQTQRIRKPSGARVLFSRRFIAMKGPQILIQAMPEVLKNIPTSS
jgi:glycosyltransferase involved in cell wall biosynthesis